MKRYLIRLVLVACTFYFVFPLIPGAQYHGNFVHALLAGALFGFTGWIVESVAVVITALLAISTLGAALMVLVPVWLLGFLVLPAVVLKMTSEMMPATLAFTGWGPAIWGGLLTLCIGVLTGKVQLKTPKMKFAAAKA